MTLIVPHFNFSSLLQGDNPSSLMSLTSTSDPYSRALDATSTDPWGPSHSLMEELRVYTQTRHCADVLRVLHDALTSSGTQWRRVLKALTTIAYCMRQDSTEVILFVTAHHALIRSLTQFEYVDAYRLDRGAAVREEAEAVMSMLQLFRSEESRGGSVRSAVREASGASTTASSASSSFRPTPSSTTGVTYPPSQRQHAQQQGLYSGTVNPTQLFPCSHWTALQYPRSASNDVTQESVDDSATLSVLMSRLEAPDSNVSEDDDIWLDIYKLLFVLNTSLPTASDDTIYHWTHHTYLLTQLARQTRRVMSAALSSNRHHDHDHGEQSVASEVHRLTKELASILGGASGAKEVRRRARKF